MFRMLKYNPLALLLALAMLPACGTELGGSLFVAGNTLPEEEDCVVQASGGGGQQVFLSQGQMDLRITDNYRVNLLVQNVAQQFEGLTGFQAQDGRLDHQMVTLTSASVKLVAPRAALIDYVGLENTDRSGAVFTRVAVDLGLFTLADPPNASDFDSLWRCDTVTGECETQYTVPFAAHVAVQGQSAAQFDAIPSNYGQMFRHLSLFVNADEQGELGAGRLEVKLTITLHGERHDHKKVSTFPWVYPVSICNGCSIRPSGLTQAQIENPQNPPGSDPVNAEEYIEGTCAPGSDEQVYDVWCSFIYPEGASEQSCQRARCLTGLGQPSPVKGDAAPSLYCPNDNGVVFGF